MSIVLLRAREKLNARLMELAWEYAAEIRAEEREACARLCEKWAEPWAVEDDDDLLQLLCGDLARAIRARGDASDSD